MSDRTPILDHLSLRVSDYERSRRFYEATLAPLGLRLIHENDAGAGFGTPENDDFYVVGAREPSSVHLAFVAPDRAAVDAFHTAALAAGATDNGGPGMREIYHPHYYGAFVLDPDGHNIEAVCHTA